MDQRPSMKSGIDLSDVLEKNLSAFRIYYSAIRCALAFVCRYCACEGAPELWTEFENLRNQFAIMPVSLKRASDELAGPSLHEIDRVLERKEIPCAELGYADYGWEQKTQFRDTFPCFFFESVKFAASAMPPPRRVDWILKWGTTPLLYYNAVLSEFKSEGLIDGSLKERIKPWKHFRLEAQAKDIESELTTYINEEYETSLRVDKECRYRRYFRVGFTRGSGEHVFDIWMKGFEGSSDSSEILRSLAQIYWRSMDEWAHLYFMLECECKTGECAGQGEIAKLNPRQMHLRNSGPVAFEWLEKYILRKPKRFLERGELDEIASLRLPPPEDFQALEKWHKACLIENGPIEKMLESIERAKPVRWVPAFYHDITGDKKPVYRDEDDVESRSEKLLEPSESREEPEAEVLFSGGFRVCRMKPEKGQEKSWRFSDTQALIVKMLDEARKTNTGLFFKEIKERSGSKATSLSNAFRGKTEDFYATLIEHSPSGKGNLYSLKKTFRYDAE